MIGAIRQSSWILQLLGLLCLVQSCASTQGGQSPDRPLQKSSQAVDLAREQIDTGQYQNAIDIYMTEYRSRPEDEVLIREYVKGLEEIMTVAEKAFSEHDLASSGRIYRVLLKNYPYFKDFADKLSFKATDLDTKLSHCKQSLSAQGFQEYRQGNLSEAIAVWESLLTIDPDNAEIKGAVKTAKLQQKNLEQRANRR